MRGNRVWVELLGLKQEVIEDVDFDQDAGVRVVSVRSPKRSKNRCGLCLRPARGFDDGRGVRRWRALDLGSVRTFVQAAAPRVRCRLHGVVVAAVPWSRHGAGHTYAFDDQVARLAVHTSRSATKCVVAQLMRIAWRTVGAILERVAAAARAGVDRFAGLRRIGVDEISYERGHKYLTVVVDHDSKRLVWAAPGWDKETLAGFSDELDASTPGDVLGGVGGEVGPQEKRSALITHVSADGATWIATVVADRCPNAVRCADPFHRLVWWCSGRARPWMRNVGRRGTAPGVRWAGGGRRQRPGMRSLKGARWALWKNPEDLTENQAAQLAWIARTDRRLHRAYLLKEGLRTVFAIA